VHGLIEIKPMKGFMHMNGLLFLFNISDHICTTYLFLQIVKGIERRLQEAFLRFEIPPPVSNVFPLTK
jgi:hypothetical protein